METPTIEVMAERLDRLELANRRLSRQVRRLRRGLLLGAAALLLGLLAWPRVAAAPRSLRAQQFVLEGGDGQIRAILGMKPGLQRPGFIDDTLVRLGYRTTPASVSGVFGPTLRVFDEAGKQRVALGMNMETGGVPFLTFADPSEKDRLAVYAMHDGGTTIALRDAASRDRVRVATSGYGHGVIAIQDQERTFSFLAPTPPAKP